VPHVTFSYRWTASIERVGWNMGSWLQETQRRNHSVVAYLTAHGNDAVCTDEYMVAYMDGCFLFGFSQNATSMSAMSVDMHAATDFTVFSYG